MSTVECWVVPFFNKTQVLAKVKLPVVPRVDDLVTTVQPSGGSRQTFRVIGVEHVGTDFTNSDADARKMPGRVELVVDPDAKLMM